MRDGWQRVTLGEICDLTKGQTATQKATPGEYPLVVTAEARASSDTYQFVDPAVCVPMVSSTGHGHASLKRVHYQDGKFAVANIITACTAKAGASVDMKYLWLYLDHLRNDLIVPRMKGTANVSLSQRALAEVPISLPSLREQERIVDLIATLDTTTQRAETEAEALWRMRAALGDQLVSSATKTAPLNDLGRLLRGAVWSKSDESGVAADGFEEVVGISVTSADGLDLSKMKYVSGLGEKAHRLEANDLIMVSSNGNPDRIGNVYEAESLRGRPFSAFQMVFRPGVPEWRGFLFEVLASPSIQETLTEMTAGSTGLKNLSVKKLRGLEVPDPREGGDIEPIRFARAAAVRAQAAVAHLRALRGNLLTVLLSGEHEIPESYDELMGVAS